MKVLSRTSDGLKRCYSILVESSDIDKEVESSIQEEAKTFKMDGFRPGKVPVKVIMRRFGNQIREDVKPDLMKKTISQVVQDEGLRVCNGCALKKVKDDNEGLEFTADFELYPDFELKSVADIELVKYVANFTDEEVLNNIKEHRKENKFWQEIEDPVEIKECHKVVADISYFNDKNDGKHENVEIELERSSVLSEFRDYLIGSKKGDTVEFTINDPKENKEVRYSVLVKEVFEEKEFQSDEEYSKQLGFESFDALKDAFRKNMEKLNESMSQNILKRNLFEKISKLYDFEVPSSLLEVEEREVIDQIKQEANRLGKVFDENIEKECHVLAVDRVRSTIVIDRIAEEEEISVDSEEIYKIIELTALYQGADVKSVVDYYKRNPKVLDAAILMLTQNKVEDMLLTQVKIIEEPCSLEELKAKDEELMDFFKDDYKGFVGDSKKESNDAKVESKSKKNAEAKSKEKTEGKASSSKVKKSAAKQTDDAKKESSKEEAPKKRARKKAE